MKKQASTESILKAIALLHAIQESHAPITAEWRFASRQLAPLFAEMAVRQPVQS